jgi:hypothetical protein
MEIAGRFHMEYMVNGQIHGEIVLLSEPVAEQRAATIAKATGHPAESIEVISAFWAY